MKRSRRNTKVSRSKKGMTLESLKRLVLEEVSKMTGELEPVENVSAEEVDADGYAETVEAIDMMKAMNIEEAKVKKLHAKLVKEARKIRRNKHIAKKRILRNIK